MFTPMAIFILAMNNLHECYDCIIITCLGNDFITKFFILKAEMKETSRSVTRSMYDAKTIIFRVFVVLAYIAFGSGIFDLLERDAASLRMANFEEYYNKTMTNILSRCTSNQTNINITIVEIRQTFMEDIFPKEWNAWGGINITVQASSVASLTI